MGNNGRPCASARPQTWSNFGDASIPDSSGWISHSSPSSSSARCSRSHAWWASIRGSSAAGPPAPTHAHAHASSGGWIVRVIRSSRDAML